MLATIVNEAIDKEDYLTSPLTSEPRLNRRDAAAKLHEDFYRELHPLKAGSRFQSKSLYI